MSTNAAMPGLKVSENRRYLVTEDGEPFFWLGDTAWELFHRSTREEADHYLRNRAERGYTVIQAVGLAEFGGLTKPNAYGRVPLLRSADGAFDPSAPDTAAEPGGYSYWDHVDYVVDKAAELGLYIALLPTWGDKYHIAWGEGPDIFAPDNARTYGRWLGERCRDRSNVIWVLGGDRALTQRRHFEIVNAMAEGLAEGDGGRHLRTFHPMGGRSSSRHVHDEPWLDFNMIQSSHGLGEQSNHMLVAADYARTPVKPTLEAEPCYEDHPRGFNPVNGYFDEADVRKAAYYGVLAGGLGITYGHHCVWSLNTEPTSTFIMTWKQAILRPGAAQMRHVRTLAESRPMLERVPDQSLLAANEEGANYAVAARGERHAFLYSPNGLALRAAMGRIAGEEVDASWFDPRTGETTAIGRFPNAGETTFLPPQAGRGRDWVLVLDAV
ncbi:Putative collagen-binding domain of a collagenase [Paenibacillus sp. UNC496MF]|uniref:glycoside hydrolase family 140 protein n=1 Tax=Paenibacillus sp. UNC496MF TaxID=1502753 RepID=UPI0008F12154|nr:glycoside hydrolase family 140 protein [Paenibacillus sp. UNC496MF]SFJ79232.1 Putative collagen-binding domain of a collagenase [Paenibacillus sp. UNC496MF]